MVIKWTIAVKLLVQKSKSKDTGRVHVEPQCWGNRDQCCTPVFAKDYCFSPFGLKKANFQRSLQNEASGLLLLAFVVCSKSIQPNLGSTGSSKSEYRYEREDRGSSLPSKEDSEPLGTSSSAASSPIQDPAATLEEREEKKSRSVLAFSSPSPDINGNFIRHSRGLTSNKGDMTKTSESREGHNVVLYAKSGSRTPVVWGS